MYNDEQIKQKIKEVMERTKDITPEQLEQDFINNFGIDAFNQLETTSKLYPFQDYISDLLGIYPLPIIYDDIPQDAKIDFKNECIVINQKFGNNLIESAKCVAHEQRHYYQLALIKTKPEDDLAIILKENYDNPIQITDPNDFEQLMKYTCQVRELDAYAFTQLAIKDFYGIDVKHTSKIYQQLIEMFILKYYK